MICPETGNECPAVGVHGEISPSSIKYTIDISECPLRGNGGKIFTGEIDPGRYPTPHIADFKIRLDLIRGASLCKGIKGVLAGTSVFHTIDSVPNPSIPPNQDVVFAP